MTNMLRLFQSSVIWEICCLLVLQIGLGQVPTATSPLHQPQPATLDQRLSVFNCVRSVLLHAAETWAMTVAALNRLRRNDVQ